MAIRSCRECKKEVSDEAATCPHCGIAKPVKKDTSLVAIVLAAVFGLFVFKACSPSSPSPSAAAATERGAGARAACREFLIRTGYASTDWGEWSAWTRVENGDGTWSVGARFMGAAPGGVTRNQYVTCVMRLEADNWRLVTVSKLQ